MKILIVGGSGLTGAHAALHLRHLGHDVTLAARARPAVDCLRDLPFETIDYQAPDFPVERLRGYASLLFAAGADPRRLPPGETAEAFYTRVNSEAIPRFFALARDAGVRRAVLIGSYYPQVTPEKIASSVYVRSRHLSDEGVRALNDERYTVCTLNAPFIIGHVPGLLVAHLRAQVQYAAGRLAGVPLVAPAGGVNHISSASLSEAIASAFERGEGGRAYLVGDENLSWKDYLEMLCAAVGQPRQLAVSTDEHPLFPDATLFAGRNAVIAYEPDMAPLSYRRHNIRAAIDEVVAAYL